MDNIIQFPNRIKKTRYYRIPLYSDADIGMVLFCVNAFGLTPNRVMIDDLLAMDPIEVIESLDSALKSDIISNIAKHHIACIRKSVEES